MAHRLLTNGTQRLPYLQRRSEPCFFPLNFIFFPDHMRKHQYAPALDQRMAESTMAEKQGASWRPKT